MTGNKTFDLKIICDESADKLNVEVTVDYIIENSGIGPCEVWGHKGVDKGVDYACIESFDWDTTQYTQEVNKMIEDAVKNELRKWEIQIMESLPQDDFKPFYQDE